MISLSQDFYIYSSIFFVVLTVSLYILDKWSIVVKSIFILSTLLVFFSIFPLNNSDGNNLLSPSVILSGFSNTTLISVLSLLILGQGVVKTRVLDNFISNFKKNIYIINTSRGKCLSTKDLILNIKKSKVVGAGLDVLEEENSNFELNQNSKDLNFLRRCDKVILTPHVAGLTYESDEMISEVLFKKIVKILKQN